MNMRSDDDHVDRIETEQHLDRVSEEAKDDSLLSPRPTPQKASK